MRFKIGSMVEVLTKKKLPLGTWRCAEIVSDDGDSYTVRYYRGRGIPKENVDKVKAEHVRPCPPPVTVSTSWGDGDVIEVLDDGSWKVSMIKEVLKDDFYQIHVVGSIDEFRVKKSNIRLRQEWKDDHWILKEKDSVDCENLIARMRRKTNIQQQRCDHDSRLKSLKRFSPDTPSYGKDYSRCIHKRRAVSKESKVADCYLNIGKVDVAAHSMENHGKTRTFNKNRKNHGEAKSLCEVAVPADSDLLKHGSLQASLLKTKLVLAPCTSVSREGRHHLSSLQIRQ